MVERAAAHASEEGEALVDGTAGGVELEELVMEEGGGGSGIGVEEGAGVGAVGDLEEPQNEELAVVDVMPKGVGVDLLDLVHNNNNTVVVGSALCIYKEGEVVFFFLLYFFIQIGDDINFILAQLK